MFVFDQKINEWSHKMIPKNRKIWGAEIMSAAEGKENLKTIDHLKFYLDNYFIKYQAAIFSIFEAITGIKHSYLDFSYFINTSPISSHNYEKRFVSLGIYHSFASYPTILIHELFHLFFYEYLAIHQFIRRNHLVLFENECNEIKEIITVVINEEFFSCIDVKDLGYPQHQKIREWALTCWLKNKDFPLFLQRVVSKYKKK